MALQARRPLLRPETGIPRLRFLVSLCGRLCRAIASDPNRARHHSSVFTGYFASVGAGLSDRPRFVYLTFVSGTIRLLRTHYNFASLVSIVPVVGARRWLGKRLTGGRRSGDRLCP